jgi:uncharacterized protein with PQ loop repeat
MSPVDALGWVAAAVGILLGLPQLVHLIRTRHTEGVSLLAWQTLLVLNVAWLVHGVLIVQANMIVTNAFGLFTTVPILVLMSRSRELRLFRVILPALIAAGVVIAADLTFGTAVFGAVVLIPGTVVNVAQTLELIRSPSVEGVSPTFLVVAVTNQVLWLSWALLVPELGTIIAASVATTITAFNVLWWVLRRMGVRAYYARLAPVPAAEVVTGG